MIEERLNSLEGHMQQLIKMVAENNRMLAETIQVVKGTSKRMDSMESKMESMESKMDSMEIKMDNMESKMDNMEKKFDLEKQLNGLRHEELIKESRNTRVDIDYIRNQSSKHDMEIHKVKALIQS
jgi:uncharacterized coiled-coil protein SlyX